MTLGFNEVMFWRSNGWRLVCLKEGVCIGTAFYGGALYGVFFSTGALFNISNGVVTLFTSLMVIEITLLLYKKTNRSINLFNPNAC